MKKLVIKKLTICIPTYNRVDLLKKQLVFLKSEINQNKNLLNEIDFIICDNASSDETNVFLKNNEAENNFFKYYINSSNLGLIGNITKLLSLSNSDFVWFVSDDDELFKGVLDKALHIILNYDNLNYIFLNFTCNSQLGFVSRDGLIKDSKTEAIKMFNESYGSLILISSCIYRRSNLMEIKNHKFSNQLSSPLLFSFYCCSKGNVFFSEKPWVCFRSGNASYAGLNRNLKLKFEEYVQILEVLVEFNYNKKEINDAIRNFLKTQSLSFLIYIFFNFSNSINLLTKYFTLFDILIFPISIIKSLTLSLRKKY